MEEAKKEQVKTEKFSLARFLAEGIMGFEAPLLHGLPIWGARYGLEVPQALGKLWSDKVGVAPTIAPDPRAAFDPSYAVVGLKLLDNEEAFRPCYVQSADHPFIRAVIGYSHEYRAFIIPKEVTADWFSAAERADLPVSGGRMPRQFWIEVQHAFIATGAKTGYYVAVKGTDTVIVPVEQDGLFQSNHTAACIQFWDRVRRSVLPDGAVDPDETQTECDTTLGRVEAPVSNASVTEAPVLPEPAPVDPVNLKEALDKIGARLVERADGSLEVSFDVASKEEALDAAKTLNMMKNYRAHFAEAFRNGMVDGVRALRKQIAGFGSETHSKCLAEADRLTAIIQEG